MRHKNFFILPNRIFEFGLKSKELAVYSCLVRHSDKDGSCFPPRSTIAKNVAWISKKNYRMYFSLYP